MSAADPANSFADFWAAQGQAFLTAQQQAGNAFSNSMQALASVTMPSMRATDLSAATADLARAGQSVAALWTAATAMAGTLTKLPSFSAGNPTVEATFRNMLDPRSWLVGTGEVDDVLGRMAEGPRFADLWDIERRYARVLQAWMTVRRAGFDHNSVVLEAWMRAARHFTDQTAGRIGASEQALDAKAALALWTDIANRELLEMQHAEPFLQTQAAMIRASTQLRIAQQELVEHFGHQYGFPTRTELDDVHHTVTDLRREVRAIRRELQVTAPPLQRRQVTSEAETQHG